MGIEEAFHKLTDTYERKARLYPAFLAVIPILGVVAGLYGIPLKVDESLIALASAMGSFYLLANIVREYGKRIEGRLFARWGGIPSTQLQRHRDTRVDRVTKAFRHKFLSNKIGAPFPDAIEESLDPLAADATYLAGTRWLLEHTRNRTKFGLLFKENVAYGFRRNALGIRPIAILVCAGSILWALFQDGSLTLEGIDLSAIRNMAVGTLVSLAVSFVLLVTWIAFFTRRTVETAAFAYADMLLRTCSVLE